MIRVVYYIPGATYGGAHNQIALLAAPLRHAGYEPIVLLPDEDGDAQQRLETAGVPVRLMPLRRLRAVRSPRAHVALAAGWRDQVDRLSRFFSEAADIVQIHGVTCVDGAAAARRAARPLVWQLLDTRAPAPLRRILTPYVVRSADVVMTTGTTIQKAFPHLDGRRGRTVAFYPPVDRERIVRAADRAGMRRAFGVAERDFLFVCLANYNPQKGIESLLDAVAELRSKRPDVVLRVRGSLSGAHPGYFEQLIERARRLGFDEDTVRPLEPDLSPATFLSAGDALAFFPQPRSEGVPTVVLEALTLGLPVVVGDAGGVREVVTDDVGVVVHARRATERVAGLESLCSRTPADRQALSRNAAELATRFELSRCVATYLDVYARVVG
jgi:glycosyltransferase involved in cell wall biosynthesis